MVDRYTKVILTIIAVNLTIMVADILLPRLIPYAYAQRTQSVYIEGGTLDYETDITAGPTLKVCTNC
jgi:hypothetical protein